MATHYDRTRQDLGNIVLLEHVNVTIPDQRLATIFYLSGLGLTRDPYLMAGIENMWVNVGRSQFHLPSRGTQVLRGHVGIVIPDPADGRKLFTIEHEVRSLTHPLYARPLVNRNPEQSNRSYVRGHDAFRGTY